MWNRHSTLPGVSADEPPPGRIDLQRTLDGALGIETLEVAEDVARSRCLITDKVRQPLGLVHGGLYAAMAESLASIATALTVWEDGMIAVGLSNATSFMRPATEGYVHALATRRHRGRTTWVWDVDCSDDQGRLCATTRVTMAVRPRPA
jgi:1,4-dihydroxy-2-naphthoyl-CoA hydrolase